MEDGPAMEFLLDKLKNFKTNEEFFLSMKRS
jgi:transcription termination factor Rho